jgi:hypothetical protein
MSANVVRSGWVPTPVSRRVDVRPAAVRKKIIANLYHKMMKNMLFWPTKCDKGRKKKKQESSYSNRKNISLIVLFIY